MGGKWRSKKKGGRWKTGPATMTSLACKRGSVGEQMGKCELVECEICKRSVRKRRYWGMLVRIWEVCEGGWK